MAAADTAKLIASLELKDLFTKRIGAAEKSLGSFDKKLDSTQGRAFKAGQQIGTGIRRGAVLAVGGIAFLAANVEKGLESLTRLDDVVTQTNAVLRSTKGAAGENAQAIRDLANKYEGLNATIDDTVIQSGENLLLTFTNIRKKAFEPTLIAALNMNQALGGGEAGLQGTIQKLGKALNDPIKGLTALGRVGITFTKTQKDQIKAAVEAGDTFKAQGIILAELNKRFGGSFLAGGSTTTGKVAKFKDAIDDLQRVLATALLPVIGKVADGLSKFLADPKIIKGVNDLGIGIAGLFSDANLKAGADFLQGAFETAKSAAPIVTSAAKATFGFVQAAVGLFKQLPPGLQGLLVGGFALNKITGGLVTNVAGGIIDAVGKSLLQRGGTPANPLFVVDVGATAGVATAAAGIGVATLASAAVIVASIAAPIIVGKMQSDANSGIATGIGTSVNNQIAGGASAADIQKSIDALDTGIHDLENMWGGQLVAGDSLEQLKAQRALLQRQLEVQLDGPSKFGEAVSGSIDGPLGKLSDQFGMTTRASSRGFANVVDALHRELFKAQSGLHNAKGAAEIAAAIKRVLASLIGKGLGGVGGAARTLGDLKAQLANTHDPKLQAALKAAIEKVERKLASRQIVAEQTAKLKDILGSNKTTAQKIVALQAVEKTIGNRDAHETKRVHDAIVALKAKQHIDSTTLHNKIDGAKRATTHAIAETTHAVNEKDLSVQVSSSFSVTQVVNSRSVASSQQTFKKFFSTAS